jgi:hypothetical protein
MNENKENKATQMKVRQDGTKKQKKTTKKRKENETIRKRNTCINVSGTKERKMRLTRDNQYGRPC